MIPLLLALAQAAPAAAPPLPSDPLPGDWRPIPADELMVMTLAGNRIVVIRLAPGAAREHVANTRKLTAAHYWDATSIYRVQDNWVTQWGGSPDDDHPKPTPADLTKVPAAEYDLPAGAMLPAQKMARSDAYSAWSGITADGWAVAGDGSAHWLAHCYATVGVARGAAPDTGSATELFMPIGGSARRLDRNYTIVGRVIEGAAFLSGLPRSGAAMGMYATDAERTPIVSVRLASDLPPAERPRFDYRAFDNARAAAMIALREHPKGMVALGGIDVCDVCDVPLTVRRAR